MFIKTTHSQKFRLFLAGFLIILGNLLILGAALMLIFTFGPAIKEEVGYKLNELFQIRYSVEPFSSDRQIIPESTDFGIVIPKLAANAPIFANVNPLNKSEYLSVLQKGVAHAKGTALPGEEGNVYLFAHSTDSFLNVGRYNAVFYLIGKLEPGDEIDVFYKGERFKYEVVEKKVVPSQDIKYLRNTKNQQELLTLQTCYPPGTTLKRLIVIAKKVTIN